ncbi:flippase-like domain-containing protein [Asanoa sp. NPDC050611]|uniref:flippase-like domain-containing protein n=1 Tax=Asanoa sp. NPDC050611 TaxID=3157098 RepID=UPI0033CA0184
MVRLRTAARELLLVAVLFAVYKGIRVLVAGHADQAMANATTVWHLERLLRLPSELAAQQAVAGHHWLVLAANSYYAYVHFPATAAALIWLYLRRPALYLRTRRILAGLTATALLLHVWLPLAPPRLAASTGLVDTGTVYGPTVYGPPDTDTLSNQYAAMPSLHVGWALAIAVALAVATRGRLRWLWLAHPVTTLAVVVVTGNHYWLDALVAVALLAAVAVVVVRARELRALLWPPVRRYGLRTLAVAVALVAVALSLRGRVPDPADVVADLAGANVGWLAGAVLVQFCSQACFARQQRALLTALDVNISRRDALAITYSRSAISMVLPAGAAMSAAFALRQYRRHGASTAVAATAMLLSGAASVVGLVLLYAGTIRTPAWADSAVWHMVPPAAVLAALLGALVVLRHRGPAPPRPTAVSPRTSIWRRLRDVADDARAVRVRYLALAIGYAALNWLFDLGCLVAAAHACRLPLTVFQLATVYLAVQVVRQIPLTPGGIGVIEASLLAGLVTAGAAQPAAAAVVLLYRLVSFWLVLPAGLVAYLRLARGPDQPRSGHVAVT